MTLAINIDAEMLKNHVQAALFSALTQEKRDELIREALKSLMDPKKEANNYYGRGDGDSPLLAAMKSAAIEVTRKIALEYLQKDTKFQEQVRDLFHEAWNKCIAAGDVRQKVVDRMAENIGQALVTKDRF